MSNKKGRLVTGIVNYLLASTNFVQIHYLNLALLERH